MVNGQSALGAGRACALCHCSLLSAVVSKSTNCIKSNCDVFRQLLTHVVHVGKAISLSIRYSPADTQKKYKAKHVKPENRRVSQKI